MYSSAHTGQMQTGKTYIPSPVRFGRFQRCRDHPKSVSLGRHFMKRPGIVGRTLAGEKSDYFPSWPSYVPLSSVKDHMLAQHETGDSGV